MEKKEFIDYLKGIFKAYNFKKKGNWWFLENEELIKKINLQKSSFGNYYYINYGWIIKGLELDGCRMHVEERMHAGEPEKNRRIRELLYFDTEGYGDMKFEINIDDEQRKKELACYIEEYLMKELMAINTKADLLKYLKEQPSLCAIMVIVKKYFGLPNE